MHRRGMRYLKYTLEHAHCTMTSCLLSIALPVFRRHCYTVLLILVVVNQNAKLFAVLPSARLWTYGSTQYGNPRVQAARVIARESWSSKPTWIRDPAHSPCLEGSQSCRSSRKLRSAYDPRQPPRVQRPVNSQGPKGSERRTDTEMHTRI